MVGRRNRHVTPTGLGRECGRTTLICWCWLDLSDGINPRLPPAGPVGEEATRGYYSQTDYCNSGAASGLPRSWLLVLAGSVQWICQMDLSIGSVQCNEVDLRLPPAGPIGEEATRRIAEVKAAAAGSASGSAGAPAGLKWRLTSMRAAPRGPPQPPLRLGTSLRTLKRSRGRLGGLVRRQRARPKPPPT